MASLIVSHKNDALVVTTDHHTPQYSNSKVLDHHQRIQGQLCGLQTL